MRVGIERLGEVYKIFQNNSLQEFFFTSANYLKIFFWIVNVFCCLSNFPKRLKVLH